MTSIQSGRCTASMTPKTTNPMKSNHRVSPSQQPRRAILGGYPIFIVIDVKTMLNRYPTTAPARIQTGAMPLYSTLQSIRIILLHKLPAIPLHKLDTHLQVFGPGA